MGSTTRPKEDSKTNYAPENSSGSGSHPGRIVPTTGLITPFIKSSKPTGRSDFYLQSYFPHTINDWNSLPEHIVNINDTQLFKSAVTSYISPSTASSNQHE